MSSTPPNKQVDGPPPRNDIDFSMNPAVMLAVVALLIFGTWLAWYLLWKPFPVDSGIPHYTKVAGVRGKLVSVGSDTLTDVIESCSKGFREIYPDVVIQLEHKGSEIPLLE